MTLLGTTDLDVHGLNLGGNVFGWTADKDQSFAVLDAYSAAGGNFVDTADVYSAWVDGNSGGESEAILGAWMAARGNREDMVVATKVAKLDGFRGLSADNIRTAADNSLRRLGIDTIDLYYAHEDDLDTPLEETLAAFGELVQAGKVRHIAASNFTAPRLRAALEVSAREDLPAYVAVQEKYNLVDRADFERDLAPVVAEHGLAVLPYSALASGFLSGKYRPGTTVDSVRASGASRYLDSGRGQAVLTALDEVAADRRTTVPAVALAWLGAQPGVAAPIASARTPEQLADLLPSVDLALTDEELARLTDASA